MVIKYLKSIRITNIILISLLFWGLIAQNYTKSLQFSYDHIWLYLSLIFTLSGGYLINNYFDIISDTTNSKAILNATKKYYLFAFLVNLILSFLCLFTSQLSGGWFQFILICHFLLFIYSFKVQHWPLIGNILVSTLCAVAIAIPEFISLNKLELNSISLEASISSTYIIFCFTLSLIRELIKDIEDIEGDSKIKSKTLPIILGVKSTKYLIGLLNILIFTMLIIGLSSSNYNWIYLMFYIPMLSFNLYLNYTIITKFNNLPYFFLSHLIKLKFFVASFWLFIKLIA